MSDDDRMLSVDFENHTDHYLAFEYEWHDLEDAHLTVPANAHPRLLVRVIDMGPMEL